MNRVDGGTIAPLIAPKRFGYVKLGIKRDREKAPLSLRMSVTSESLSPQHAKRTQQQHAIKSVEDVQTDEPHITTTA